MTDLPNDSRKFNIKVTTTRSTKRQSKIKKTQEELDKRKNQLTEVDAYVSKRVNEFRSSWSKFYFGKSPESYAILIDYKDARGKTNSLLASKPIHRIQREYLIEVREGMRQINQIVNSFGKKYKQDLIDSQELTEMIRELLQLGEYSKHEKINTYGFASNLFYITLKILIENAPTVIQKQMIKSIEQFIEMNNLPLELGFKKSVKLIKPKINSDRSGNLRLQLSETS